MNETIRDYLKRRVRWCMGIAICGWVLIPLSMSANKVIPEPSPTSSVSSCLAERF